MLHTNWLRSFTTTMWVINGIHHLTPHLRTTTAAALPASGTNPFQPLIGITDLPHGDI
jgi:hypothetical protein